MASKVSNYITYARDLEYEPQSLYLECGQAARICVELKSLGMKRILIMSKAANLTGKNVTDFIGKFEEAGFRIFNYYIKYNYPSSADITAALNDYRGYNCDTIIVFGGGAEIFCAKMVSAMAINNMKDPVEAEGYGKIKKDISVLCCVDMDNSTAVSSNIAEFRDENTGRWVTVMSEYLVPQIVVIDTDIAMKTITQVSLCSAFDSFAMGLECCLSPASDTAPEYRACALNAVSLVADNILAMKDNPDDGYLRKKIAVAGVYAGMAVRATGFGYAHLTSHILKTLLGPEHGKYYFRILGRFLEKSLQYSGPRLAQVYDQLVRDEIRPGCTGLTGSLDPHYTIESSSRACLETMNLLYDGVFPNAQPLPQIPRNEVKNICDTLRSQAAEFGLLRFDDELLTGILERL